MDPLLWETNWVWGLPLIVLTSVVHVLGLGIINETVVHALRGRTAHRHFTAMFAAAMSLTVLLATLLHAFEAALWAAAYRLLSALPDAKTAMLYSLSAITTYGHASALLAEHWRLLGALEALNGVLLFGLSTAFLFALIQGIWPPGSRRKRLKAMIRQKAKNHQGSAVPVRRVREDVVSSSVPGASSCGDASPGADPWEPARLGRAINPQR